MGVPLVAPLAVLVFLAAFIPLVGILFAGAVVILITVAAKGWVAAVILLGISRPRISSKATCCRRRWRTAVAAADYLVLAVRGVVAASWCCGRRCAGGRAITRAAPELRRRDPVGGPVPAAIRVPPLRDHDRVTGRKELAASCCVPCPASRSRNDAMSKPPSDAGADVDILIQRLDPGLPLPVFAHPGDAGADLYAAEDVDLAPGERALVATGVAIALPAGYAAFVHPRSGLAARHGVTIVNAPGTVDAGYRGEIKVTLLNTHRSQPVSFRRGDRIAQLVIQRVERVQFHEVASLPGSARGDGGFGSTGGHAAGCASSTVNQLRSHIAGKSRKHIAGIPPRY